MKFAGFIGPSYQAQSVYVDAERAVNLYLERVESGQGKHDFALFGRPGLAVFATCTDSPLRALFSQDGRVFAVAGGHFFEVNADGTVTNYGAIANDGGLASICSSGDAGHQLFIVSGGKGYIFDLAANTLTQIAAAAFPSAATMGVFIDGYFIVLEHNTNQIGLSALFDGTSWSGLDVAQRESASDRLAAIYADHRDLMLFGTKSTEVWRNTGAANFPFEPVQGAFIEKGVVTWACTKFDNGVAFLSQGEQGGGMVYRLNGYQPQRISTHAMEFAIGQYPTYTDAEFFAEEFIGHTFLVMNFPSGNATWVYDAATNTLHERDWKNTQTGQFERARPRCHCFGFERHLVGDRTTGVIYRESFSLYDDAGVPISRRRRAPIVSNENKRMYFPLFTLDCRVGDGIATDQARIPKATLRYSNDAGHTWSRDRTVSLGKQGEFATRVQWANNGSGRQRVFEVEISDPLPVALSAAYLTAIPGAN